MEEAVEHIKYSKHLRSAKFDTSPCRHKSKTVGYPNKVRTTTSSNTPFRIKVWNEDDGERRNCYQSIDFSITLISTQGTTSTLTPPHMG